MPGHDANNDPKQPNLLVVCTDQLRWDWLGCAGASWMHTPNIDRLAASGVRFPVCTSNAPVCVPARAGLATGRQPLCIGAADNQYHLDPNLPTYYQRLRDAGYRVGCAGKLDLAKGDHDNGRDGKRPRTFQWGFTDPIEIEGKGHSLGQPRPQGPYGHWLEDYGLYQRYREERKSRVPPEGWYAPSELPKETFLDVYQADRAVDWLDTLPLDSPWHLFVSFSGPHAPHDPPHAYAEPYWDADIPPPWPAPGDARSAAFQNKGPGPTDPQAIHWARAAYSGYVQLLDEQLGRILEALDRRGEAERTYVFFTSDHGEMLGDLGHWTKSRPYEGSARVPMIAAGPGIPAGQESGALLEWIDLHPTLLALAGLPAPEALEARSFADCLFEPSRAHRSDAAFGLRKWWCLRTERYKLLDYWNDASELYDLREDPGEQHNIFERMQQENPDLVAELHKRLNARFFTNPYAGHRI